MNILILVLLVTLSVDIVLIFYICYVLAKKAGITQCLKRMYKTLEKMSPRPTSEAEADVETDTGSLPRPADKPQKV